MMRKGGGGDSSIYLPLFPLLSKYRHSCHCAWRSVTFVKYISNCFRRWIGTLLLWRASLFFIFYYEHGYPTFCRYGEGVGSPQMELRRANRRNRSWMHLSHLSDRFKRLLKASALIPSSRCKLPLRCELYPNESRYAHNMMKRAQLSFSRWKLNNSWFLGVIHPCIVKDK